MSKIILGRKTHQELLNQKMPSLAQEASALLFTGGSITMWLSSLRHFPENLVCTAGWGFGFAQGEFVLPQAPQPRARRECPPAWPWCLPCLARTGDRTMSCTAFWVDLTSLLLYPRMLAWGSSTVRCPAEQAAAWLCGRAVLQTSGVSSSHQPHVCL